MRRYTVVVDGTPFIIDVVETAADRFSVTVDGATYEAALEADEDLPGAVITPQLPAPGTPRATPPEPAVAGAPPDGAAAAPAQPDAPAESGDPSSPPSPAAPGPALPPRVQAPTPGTVGGSRADIIGAPMPGVVLQVHVTAGAVLKRGDPVLVLEAMKMRNTIRAPRTAQVLAVEVEAGQPVGPGDVLVRLGDAPG